MRLIENLLSDRLVQALGWTILHSLWQGAILAILLAVLLIVMRRNSSNARYVASISALFTMFLVLVITFLSHFQINQIKTNNTSSNTIVAPLMPSNNTQILDNQVINENYFAFFGDYFEEHLPLIVSIWLLGVMILMLRFLGGIAYLQRLKHYKTYQVADFWQGTTNFLATQMKLKKPVSLLESAMVKVPMVIGWLKPVILLPIGTINGLTTRQVEIILAHELAHVYRHDYLVNILQSLVEIALFFNPFVWWISASIREERENCCDDLAVKVTGEDQLAFAQTLVSLEEMRWQPTALAMAMLGNKGSLLNRVKRLVQQNTPNSTFSEGFISALVLVFCLTIASFNARTSYSELTNSLNPLGQISEDSWIWQPGKTIWESLTNSSKNDAKKSELPELVDIRGNDIKKSKEDTIRFGKDFMIITDSWGKAKLYKNGTEIPEEDFAKYKEVFQYIPGKKNKTPSGNFSINYSKDGEIFSLNIPIPVNINLDEDGFTPMPPMPPMPPMNPIDPIPPIPPIPAISFEGNGKYSYTLDDDGENTVIFFKDGKVETLYSNGKLLNNDDPKYKSILKDLEKKQEKSKKEYEKHQKEYLEKMEEYKQKLQESRNKNKEHKEKHQESIQKYEESMRRYEESMREYERKRADYQRNNHVSVNSDSNDDEKMKTVYRELERDGLKEKNAKRTKIFAKNNRIEINGKKLGGELFEKYKKLFKRLNIVDLDTKSSWTYENEED